MATKHSYICTNRVPRFRAWERGRLCHCSLGALQKVLLRMKSGGTCEAVPNWKQSKKKSSEYFAFRVCQPYNKQEPSKVLSSSASRGHFALTFKLIAGLCTIWGATPMLRQLFKRPFGLPHTRTQELMHVAGSQRSTPNPSIEGMPKRLRLLCTPHVKR